MFYLFVLFPGSVLSGEFMNHVKYLPTVKPQVTRTSEIDVDAPWLCEMRT